MDSYSESRFRSNINNALEAVKRVLENNRAPQIASPDIEHRYEGCLRNFRTNEIDKYLLAELLANTALAAQVNCLEYFGLSPKNIDQILEWGQSRSGVFE